MRIAFLLWFTSSLLPLAAADWPCWRGPEGSGTVSSGAKTVDAAAAARLAWISADPIPPAGWDVTSVTCSGGLNNPVLADGRIYLTYYEMSGEVVAKGWEKNKDDRRQAQAFPTEAALRRRWLVGADDVIHCFDAATGTTLWRKVFKDQALNYNHRAPGLKTGPHMTPCVADGRLYATGALMALYCLDAKTGEVAWQNPLPAECKKLRDDALAAETVIDMKHRFCNVHLHVVGNVLVVPASDRELTGVDIRTGKQVWTSDAAGGGTGVGPVRWTSGGTTYLIQGRSCIDPQDGRVLWTAAGTYDTNTVPAVAGEMMVSVTGSSGGKADADGETSGGTNTLEGFRITPAGAQRVWRNDCGGQAVVNGASPIIMAGKVFANIATTRGKPHFLIQIDLATGKETGRAELPRFNPVWDSLIGGDGLIFKVPDRVPRGLALFKAGATGVDLRGILDEKELYGWCSTGIYVDGRLYFRRWERLVCYDLRKP